MKKKKTSINRRVNVIDGQRGWFARFGYFTPQVQKVVKKWKHRESFIEEYFLPIAAAAWWKTNDLKISVAGRAHWPLVWELAIACEKVRALPKTNIAYWLFRLELSKKWEATRQEIIDRGGPRVEVDALEKRAARLGLIAPTSMQKGYLKVFGGT